MTKDMSEEEKMMVLMGFGGFDSTKGKHVVGTDVSAADVKQQRTYRQYMNRKVRPGAVDGDLMR
ncbi:hypothetical protein DFJ74DRAFT_707543 [Hyaloraphidium curvatum]|nr:hypothetical protein DFJ74DRAFT_707543 [Hyaloraphidium curvatum]